MIFSTSFSTRAIIFFLAAFICLSGCAAQHEPSAGAAGLAPNGESGLKIAVFPIVNYSAAPAPLDRLNQLLVEGLQKSGLNILASDTVNSVLARHRIRYLAGVNKKTTLNFKNETGEEAVLITWLEYIESEAAFFENLPFDDLPEKHSAIKLVADTSEQDFPFSRLKLAEGEYTQMELAVPFDEACQDQELIKSVEWWVKWQMRQLTVAREMLERLTISQDEIKTW